MGARVLAVANGNHPLENLREADADRVLPDLTDLPKLRELLQF